MTKIDMDWTDEGARVLSTIPINCPVCGIRCEPNVLHLCGDRAGKYCPRCGGSGKVDRGNGSTKLCDCVAGLIERARRRSLRAKKNSGGQHAR